MFSSADASVVARDSRLPGLRALLDPAMFLDLLRAAMPQAELCEATGTYLRYKPGTSCMAGYRLVGAATEFSVYARTVRQGDEGKLQKISRRGGDVVVSPLTVGRLLLPQAGVLVVVHPNDDQLPSMRLLEDGTALGELVSQLWAAPAPQPSWEPLAYKPERRFVARVESGRREGVLRFYTHGGFKTANRNLKLVGNWDDVRTPARLGRSVRNRAVLLQWLRGRQMFAELTGPMGDALQPHLARAGEMIARLAGHRTRKLPQRSLSAEAAELLAVVRWAQALWPPLAERIGRLAEQTIERLSQLPPTFAPVHGDFYAKQVLIQDDDVALLDLDQAALADPAADLANFAAHLERHAISGHLPRRRGIDAAAIVTAAYEAARKEDLAERLPAYRAARLLRLLPHFFRSREPDWPERMRKALDAAAEALGSGAAVAHAVPAAPAAGARPRVADSGDLLNDPALAVAAAALTPGAASVQLLPLLHAAGVPAGELARLRLVRHKPGRRCLIEYEFAGPGGDGDGPTVLGKVRARGTDLRSLRVQLGLWSAGFGDDSPDGISIPRPLGAVSAFHMVAQLKVGGTPGGAVLATAKGPSFAKRAARAMRKIHATSVQPLRAAHGVADELALLRDRLARVAAAHPIWTQRLFHLMRNCEQLAASLPTVLPVPIHRDFYPDQLIVEPGLERLLVLDFDLFCLGDPALDAGNFIAHIREQSLRCTGSPHALQNAETAFCDEILRHQDHPASTARAIHVWTCLALARHVYLSTVVPGRAAWTETTLQAIEATVSCPQP